MIRRVGDPFVSFVMTVFLFVVYWEMEKLYPAAFSVACILWCSPSDICDDKKQRAPEAQAKHTDVRTKEEDEGLEDEEEEEEEHGETLCGACGENYASDEFWICCDICERWFHGKCVKITPAKAEHIKQYKCPSCSSTKRARPS